MNKVDLTALNWVEQVTLFAI